MRSKESNRQQAILKLERDLLNGPYHCFCYHVKCSTDFCKTAQQSATSEMQSTPPDNDSTSNFHDSSSTSADITTASDSQHDNQN